MTSAPKLSAGALNIFSREREGKDKLREVCDKEENKAGCQRNTEASRTCDVNNWHIYEHVHSITSFLMDKRLLCPTSD